MGKCEVMDRAVFFAEARKLTKGFTQTQVDVANAILDACKGYKAEHVAYILGTAWGEARLTPQRENMNYTAKRIRQVWPTRPEAVKFAGDPRGLANAVYNGRLGNRKGSNDGWIYRGGGVDQLTGLDNYSAVGISGKPEAILQPAVAVKSIVHGMTTGRYRGRKLSDFDRGNGFDFVNARGIVNADVTANGVKYANYAKAFLSALQKAGWSTTSAGNIDNGAGSTIARPANQFVVWLGKLLAAIFGGRK